MRIRSLAPFALAAVCLAPDAGAQLARTVDAGGGLYAQQSFRRALVREPSGVASELSLPPGGALYRIAPLLDGWILSGEIDTRELSDFFLLRSQNGLRKSFPLPANRDGNALRANPVPLVARGELVGLAWIAGPRVRQSSVYVSRWSGVGWSSPELVSPHGLGTQIGLAGAVLADGSWLLAWSAFDGGDDEIVWSRRRAAGWSTPQRLHGANDHPDIVPSVVAAGSGALAAWSSSDGSGYRVRLARFAEGRWTELDCGAPQGSLHPTLIPEERRTALLYRTVAPAAWTLRELDETGAPVRRAVLADENPFRPGLVLTVGLTPVFEWPGELVEAPLRSEIEWRPER